MVILKKVKGSTLMETLVATILIVIVFMVASGILNSLFSSTIKSNTRNIEATLNELQYLYNNKKLELPYLDNNENWQISVESFIENNQKIIEFEAINSTTKQTITKQHIEVQ